MGGGLCYKFTKHSNIFAEYILFFRIYIQPETLFLLAAIN